MPVYRFEHTCGLKHDQFLNADKDTILLDCPRCGGKVTARQVRDTSIKVAKNNDVVGLLRHEPTS